LRVFLVGFLSFDRFDEFRVADYHMAGLLQNVMDWNPVFPCGFHADNQKIPVNIHLTADWIHDFYLPHIQLPSQEYR